MKRIHILILNWKSPGELEMCLAFIIGHTGSLDDVVVIESGSSDEIYARFKGMIAAFGDASLRETTASGFSFAVNRELAEIADRNDKVLVLNNNTLETPDWLSELRYVLVKHEDAGIAVPRQVIPAGATALKLHMPAADAAFECDINLSSQHDNVLDSDVDREDNLIKLSLAPPVLRSDPSGGDQGLGHLDHRHGPHCGSEWIFCEALRRILNQRILYTPHSNGYHLQGVATPMSYSSAQLPHDQPSVVQGTPSDRAEPQRQSERP